MTDIVIKVFSAEWCAPCKAYKPTIESIENKGYTVEKYNIDKSIEEALDFNVRSIPTTIILKGGIEYKRLSGVKSEAELLNILGD